MFRTGTMSITMFDMAKPALAQIGVPVRETWRETRQLAARQADAQLARKNIRPETAAKWSRVGQLIGTSKGQ